MIDFTCSCKWEWIISRSSVYGPIIDGQTGLSRIRKYQEWKDEEPDCYSRFRVSGLISSKDRRS